MKKLLIIEDNADIVDMVNILFANSDFEVIDFEGKIPAEKVMSINPSIIIMDQMLSDGLGSDMCLELKSNELTKHFPVVLFSARHDLEEIAKKCHADAFVYKPFNIYDFVSLVNGMALSAETISC